MRKKEQIEVIANMCILIRGICLIHEVHNQLEDKSITDSSYILRPPSRKQEEFDYPGVILNSGCQSTFKASLFSTGLELGFSVIHQRHSW
jgi:hypothetical protein